MSQQPPSPQRRPTLYFAYGGNMALSQMAQCCPKSKFIGRATLRDYYWHINSKGYADVVAAPAAKGYRVEGLVFELHQSDEARLDSSEAVRHPAYAKESLEVTLRLPDKALYRRPTTWIQQHSGAPAVIAEASDRGESISQRPDPHLQAKVLVYVGSAGFSRARPKQEYVDRLNTGIEDAVALGIDPAYFSVVVQPFLLPPPRRSRSQTRGRVAVVVNKDRRRRRSR